MERRIDTSHQPLTAEDVCDWNPLLNNDSVTTGSAVVDPIETLQRLLLLEMRSGCKRNSSYLQEVQRDGMLASWRQKMSRWMFETGHAFDMAKDTAGCAINYMDQYLSSHSVSKHKLQLLSLVSLSVASKINESQPISMDEMKVLCENKFSRKDIWGVEAELMKVMNWKLNPLTPFTFARDLVSALRIEDDQNLLDSVMEFLQDVTEDYESVEYCSSTLAITAVYMHIKIFQIDLEDLFAKVISSLQVLCASKMVDAFHYLVRLYHSKNSSELSSVAEVKEVDGFSIARSPCSIDADLGEHVFSLAWVTEFSVFFEDKRTVNDDSDNDSYLLQDSKRKPKRIRTAEY